jgi:hypothetical protein
MVLVAMAFVVMFLVEVLNVSHGTNPFHRHNPHLLTPLSSHKQPSRIHRYTTYTPLSHVPNPYYRHVGVGPDGVGRDCVGRDGVGRVGVSRVGVRRDGVGLCMWFLF